VNTRSVLFSAEEDHSPMWFYRAFWPAECLNAYGWAAEVTQYLAYPSTKREWEKDPRFRSADPIGRVTGEPTQFVTMRILDDMEVGGRCPLTDMPDAIGRAQAAGQVVVYDIDDDHWNLPPWHPLCTQDVMNPRARFPEIGAITELCKVADGVLASTDSLAQSVRDNVPGAKVFTVRNGVNVSMFKPTRTEHGPLRLGYAANAEFHQRALVEHAPYLAKALDGRDVEFWHLGSPMDGLMAKILGPDFPVPIVEEPWVDYEDLGLQLAKVDIGMVIRQPSIFNEGQSTTSGLAWSAAGKPFLATTSAEYRRLEETAGVGYLATDPEDFGVGLAELIDRPDLRCCDWRARVHDHHGPKPTQAQYSNVFAELLGGR
jgi:hypothetical protein